MRRSALVSLLALALAVGAAAAVLLALGGETRVASETASLAGATGLLMLLLVHGVAAARAPGSLRLQYAVGVAGVALLLLVAVLWTARQMFVSERDAAVLVSLVVFAAIVGARAAAILAQRSARDVARLHEGLERIARDDLGHRIPPQGAAELRQLAEAANRMAEALQRARAERERSDAARRALVAAVSHDLRTPLAALRVVVDGLRDGVIEPAALDQSLATMDRQLRALSRLVDDLFELARIDAGDLRWELRAVRVDELVDETVESFRPQAEQRGLELREAVPGDLAVRGDPDRLQRVLANLLQNAIGHTTQARQVTVRAERVDGHVLLEVADDGVGLPAEQADLAFERFWRGGNGAARPAGDGAGLGLPICRAIVEAHGGRIWIEPGAERGTRVRLVLPLAA